MSNGACVQSCRNAPHSLVNGVWISATKCRCTGLLKVAWAEFMDENVYETHAHSPSEVFKFGTINSVRRRILAEWVSLSRFARDYICDVTSRAFWGGSHGFIIAEGTVVIGTYFHNSSIIQSVCLSRSPDECHNRYRPRVYNVGSHENQRVDIFWASSVDFTHGPLILLHTWSIRCLKDLCIVNIHHIIFKQLPKCSFHHQWRLLILERLRKCDTQSDHRW